MAAVVHVSAWFVLPRGDDGGLLKQRVRLEIGVLRVLREVWTLAEKVEGQVAGVVRELVMVRGVESRDVVARA